MRLDALAQPHVQSSIFFSYDTNSNIGHASNENVSCQVISKIYTEFKCGKNTDPVYSWTPIF